MCAVVKVSQLKITKVAKIKKMKEIDIINLKNLSSKSKITCLISKQSINLLTGSVRHWYIMMFLSPSVCPFVNYHFKKFVLKRLRRLTEYELYKNKRRD